MATENTVNIFVELDLDAKYRVVLTDDQGESGRSRRANNDDKIHWKKRDAGDSFSILRLEPDDENVFPFPVVDGNGQQLSVTFKPNKPSPHSYKYNLVVKGANGIEYKTDGTSSADSLVPEDLGRPVIRN